MRICVMECKYTVVYLFCIHIYIYVYNCIKCGQNALDFGEYDGMQRHAFILDFHFASRKEISFEGESLNEFGRRRKWPSLVSTSMSFSGLLSLTLHLALLKFNGGTV